MCEAFSSIVRLIEERSTNHSPTKLFSPPPPTPFLKLSFTNSTLLGQESVYSSTDSRYYLNEQALEYECTVLHLTAYSHWDYPWRTCTKISTHCPVPHTESWDHLEEHALKYQHIVLYLTISSLPLWLDEAPSCVFSFSLWPARISLMMSTQDNCWAALSLYTSRKHSTRILRSPGTNHDLQREHIYTYQVNTYRVLHSTFNFQW